MIPLVVYKALDYQRIGFTAPKEPWAARVKVGLLNSVLGFASY